MKKIILVSTFYPPAMGGVEKQVEQIAQNLVFRDYQVEVWATGAMHDKTKRNTAPKREVQQGVKIKRFRYLFGIGDFFRFAPLLPLNLAFAKFDLVHQHNVHDAHLFLVSLICFLRRKKLVLTGHNPFAVGKQKRGRAISILVSTYDWLLRVFGIGIKNYIAIVESEKLYIEKHFPFLRQKVALVPNGIDQVYYQKVPTQKNSFLSDFGIDVSKYRLVFGVACRINYVKGIQNLKQAVEALPDCLFLIAGPDDGYLESLKTLYRDCENIKFIGGLDKNQMYSFYLNLDAFLLPSIYEPFGLTVVESMAIGKTVFASDNGGPAEILAEFPQLIISQNKPEIWTEKLKSFKKDKKLEANLQFAAERYKWSNVILSLCEIYNSDKGNKF